MKDESVITNYNLFNDNELDNTIRPETIDEYIGQNDVKENIRVFVKAAKMRNEALDHVLLYGPPGLGKTTLAFIIAPSVLMPNSVPIIASPPNRMPVMICRAA